MEYDVCEEGGIVAEHGSDAIAALNDATARKQADPETLITILLSANGDAPEPLVGDGDGLAGAAFVEGALWARDFAEQNPDTFARLIGRESAQGEFDRRRAAT